MDAASKTATTRRTTGIRKTKKPVPISFDAYQRHVEQTDETKKTIVSLLGLVGEIGDLHTVIKRLAVQRSYPSLKNDLTEELGDILWYLASLASRYNLSLQEIAQTNFEKTTAFYMAKPNASFDRQFPIDEQLPRKFEVVFEQKTVNSGVQVKVKVNDVFIGDSLTDNSHVDDGYRFHDVFHLAYAAILGWSPVTRALLKRKRKSWPSIDNIEDGARAVIVEEAISIFIFNQRLRYGGYENLRSIGFSLLKTVKTLCSNLEVKDRNTKDWQKAIFMGYEMFHALKKHKGGVISVDLDKQDISFSPNKSIKPTLRGKQNASVAEPAKLPNSVARSRKASTRKPR